MLNVGAVCEVLNVNRSNPFKSGFVADGWNGGKVVVVGVRKPLLNSRHQGSRLIIAYDAGFESLCIGYAWENNLKQVNTLTRHLSIPQEGVTLAFE